MFKMGYLEKRKTEVQGTLFARTTKIPPHISTFDFFFYDSSTNKPISMDDNLIRASDCLMMKNNVKSQLRYKRLLPNH